MTQAFDVTTGDRRGARAVRVDDDQEIDEALASLGLPHGPVVLLFGGASNVAPGDVDRIESFIRDAFIPAVDRIGGLVVDGGTDAGVMRILGDARVRSGAAFRLVGVVPFVKARVEGSPGSTPLAPGHTDFVLVPGEAWGVEAPWFHRIADRLSAGASVTVLVNGGPIALDEIMQSLDLGRRVVVIDGTGRAADEIASDIGRSHDPSMAMEDPAITVVDATVTPLELATELTRNAVGERRR